MNTIQTLPELGVGVGFRAPFRADLFLQREKFDFLEITADHYLEPIARKAEELALLNAHFPLIPHSLDLSLGSADGIDREYLEKLAGLIEQIKPAWFSDHLCFTGSGGVRFGHLAPVPYTVEALKTFVRNISHVKKRIAVPLILENITYTMRFPSSEMSEAEFVGKLLEETDCGLLLDVTNLYINARNHGFDWRRFLDEIPAERIVQLHFVGLHRHRDTLVDAHADRTQAEIWEVYREVCRRGSIKGAILERDENFPPFAEIVEEVETARGLLRQIAGAKETNAADRPATRTSENLTGGFVI